MQAGLDDAARRRSSLGATNSDLAFTGKYAIQGNYNGFQIWDISNPAQAGARARPISARRRRATCRSTRTCSSCRRGDQRPRRLRLRGRAGAGEQGSRCAASASSTSPTSTQPEVRRRTCRRAAARTRTRSSTDPSDKDNVYIYVSGSAGVRSADELPGCTDGAGSTIRTRARFRIEVIKVPLAHSGAGGDRQLAAHLPRTCAPPPRRVEPSAAAPDAARSRRPRRGRSGAAGGAAGAAAPARRRRRRGGPRRPRRQRAESVPRHHRLSGDRPRRRRVRRLRPAARHPATPAQPEAHRRGRRLEHVVLALGDVQQRRHEDAVHRRMGRRHRAALPRRPTSWSGAPTRSSRSRTTR